MQPLKEWFVKKTVISAEKVKKLEPGTVVYVHRAYGKNGEHKYDRATVVQYGKSKKLRTEDAKGFQKIRAIRSTSEVVYTLD